MKRLTRRIVAPLLEGSIPSSHPIIIRFLSLGRSQVGKARDFDSRMRWFESSRPSQCDPLAQSVEHLTFNQGVPRSYLSIWVDHHLLSRMPAFFTTSFAWSCGGTGRRTSLGGNVRAQVHDLQPLALHHHFIGLTVPMHTCPRLPHRISGLKLGAHVHHQHSARTLRCS